MQELGILVVGNAKNPKVTFIDEIVALLCFLPKDFLTPIFGGLPQEVERVKLFEHQTLPIREQNTLRRGTPLECGT